MKRTAIHSYKICYRILSVSRVTGTFQNISRSAIWKRDARPQGMRLRNAWNVMKFSRVSTFYRVRFPLGIGAGKRGSKCNS